MEVRKNKLKGRASSLEFGTWKRNKNRKTNSKIESWKKQKSLSIIVGCWLLAFSLLAQPVLALTSNVRIEGPNQTIFNGSVNVPQNTTVKDNLGNPHTINGYKEINALVEASKTGNFPLSFSYWGPTLGLGIDSINGFSAPTYGWWNQRINWTSAQQGISSQTINNNDSILVHFTGTPQSPWSVDKPLKLEVSKTSLNTNEVFTINTTYFDDANSKFKPTNATVFMGNQGLNTNQQGTLDTSIGIEGQFSIYATKPGFIRSNRINVSVGKNTPPSQNIQLPDKPNSNDNLNLATNPVTNKQISDSLKRAIRYLRYRQSRNGKIENPAVSAWAAIAFASVKINPAKVKRVKGIKRSKRRSLLDYLKRYSQTSLNRGWLKKHRKTAKPLVTDYARQIMAIYASGKNPRNFGGINHIKEIVRFYKGGQFGSKNLVNDDIFSIIAYRASRVNIKDRRFRGSLGFILRNQHLDGGFSYSANTKASSDVDTTAAAIQALVLAKKSGVKNLNNAIRKAYNYLVSKQNKNGGFSYNSRLGLANSQSSAWAMQAITSFKGKSAVGNLVSTKGVTPQGFQLALQDIGGGFKYDADSNTDAWTTASVIPALANKPWLVRRKAPISINANRKRIKKGRVISIYGRFDRILKGTLTLRYKRGHSKWRSAKRIRVNGRTYKTKVRLNRRNYYVFSVKYRSRTSRNMIIYSK